MTAKKTLQGSGTDVPDSLDLIPIPSSMRSKAGKKARRKGSGYERILCKSFSDLWDSKFFRTPMSGGSQLRYDYNLAGDISTPDLTFPYHIEAKNQEALKSFYNIFISSKCPIWSWWKQCVSDCPNDKIPLLVFTKNFMPSFVMVPHSYGTLVEEVGATEVGEGDIHNSLHEFIRVRKCAIMTLKRFLSFNKQVHIACCAKFLAFYKDEKDGYKVTL